MSMLLLQASRGLYFLAMYAFSTACAASCSAIFRSKSSTRFWFSGLFIVSMSNHHLRVVNRDVYCFALQLLDYAVFHSSVSAYVGEVAACPSFVGRCCRRTCGSENQREFCAIQQQRQVCSVHVEFLR